METKMMPQPSQPGFPGDYVPTDVPVGTVVAFAGQVAGSISSPPADHTTNIESMGWMVCDGRPLNCCDYPHLFAALGYLYGGEGSQFNLPDYQGYFLRGLAKDIEHDPDINDRRVPNEPVKEYDDKTKSTEIGSIQDYAMQDHKHDFKISQIATSPSSQETAAVGNTDTQTGFVYTETGKYPRVSQKETRPKNIYVYYIIKYTYLGR
jgi:microcystin-dependent protein